MSVKSTPSTKRAGVAVDALVRVNLEERILTLMFNTSPTHKSPYGLYGHPPMWEVGRKDGVAYTVRHTQTTTRGPIMEWIKVPGYVLEKVDTQTGKLVGQGVEYPCDYTNHDPVLLDLISANDQGYRSQPGADAATEKTSQ